MAADARLQPTVRQAAPLGKDPALSQTICCHPLPLKRCGHAYAPGSGRQRMPVECTLCCPKFAICLPNAAGRARPVRKEAALFPAMRECLHPIGTGRGRLFCNAGMTVNGLAAPQAGSMQLFQRNRTGPVIRQRSCRSGRTDFRPSCRIRLSRLCRSLRRNCCRTCCCQL